MEKYMNCRFCMTTLRNTKSRVLSHECRCGGNPANRKSPPAEPKKINVMKILEDCVNEWKIGQN